MSAEESLSRAEELLARLEKARIAPSPEADRIRCRWIVASPRQRGVSSSCLTLLTLM